MANRSRRYDNTAKKIPAVRSVPKAPEETLLHPLDDERDGLSPLQRNGRRIAMRQERQKAILLKFTIAEHDSLRRVAQHLGYSLAQTLRLLVKEREEALLEAGVSLPNALELDMDIRSKKTELRKKTEAWLQKKRNAFQRRETKLRQKAARMKKQLETIAAKEEKTLAELKAMEDVRALKRGISARVTKEATDKNISDVQAYKASVKAVEYAILLQSKALGRKLTETEKWTLGKQLRGEKS